MEDTIIRIESWWTAAIHSLDENLIELCWIIREKSDEIAKLFHDELKAKWKDTNTPSGSNKWKLSSSHSRCLQYKVVIRSDTKVWEVCQESNKTLFKRLSIVLDTKVIDARDRVMWWEIYDFESQMFVNTSDHSTQNN